MNSRPSSRHSGPIKFGKQGETLSQQRPVHRFVALCRGVVVFAAGMVIQGIFRDADANELLSREMTKFRLLSIAAVVLRRYGQTGVSGAPTQSRRLSRGRDHSTGWPSSAGRRLDLQQLFGEHPQSGWQCGSNAS